MERGFLGQLVLGGLCLLASWSDEGAPGGVVQTFGVNFSVGDVVAEFELAAPDHTPFILHGTMPVPPGMHIPGSAQSPFLVRAQNGSTTRAQVEVVTRYPSAAEGSDVVEILATVQRPGNAGPGDRIHYAIVWSPNPSGTLAVDTDVQTLLDTADSLIVRSTDVFGHSYEADVLRDLRDDTSELRTLRDGPVAKQVRTYENLVPVLPASGATGTLPHMMGVHSFVTIWDAEPFFSLDVRFHNGHEGFDPGSDQDDPVGKLYFNELELVMPAGWNAYQAYESPDLGNRYLENTNQVLPIVAPIGGGEMHMMPIQSRFGRRLIVVRDGSEARAQSVLAEAGLGFCRDGENDNEERLLSWWNPGSGRYWAQNLPLPALGYLNTKNNFRSEMVDDFNELNAVITNGTIGPWPIVSEDLGWAHPWGGSGAVSGSEIVSLGWARSHLECIQRGLPLVPDFAPHVRRASPDRVVRTGRRALPVREMAGGRCQPNPLAHLAVHGSVVPARRFARFHDGGHLSNRCGCEPGSPAVLRERSARVRRHRLRAPDSLHTFRKGLGLDRQRRDGQG